MDQSENEFLASFSQNVNSDVNININVDYEYCSCSSRCIRNDIIMLKSKMERIEEKLDAILQKMDTNIIKNCDKMGEHIDFVNNVYDTVKVPLHYISNKVQKIIGGDNRTFQYENRNAIQIEDSNDDEYLFTESD
jgi:iron-sulfur cluster repair protein YtfE (RIC family)